MSRIGITEDDKQRVLAIQEKMSIGTQQDTMQAILNAADAAIALECWNASLQRLLNR